MGCFHNWMAKKKNVPGRHTNMQPPVYYTVFSADIHLYMMMPKQSNSIIQVDPSGRFFFQNGSVCGEKTLKALKVFLKMRGLEIMLVPTSHC